MKTKSVWVFLLLALVIQGSVILFLWIFGLPRLSPCMNFSDDAKIEILSIDNMDFLCVDVGFPSIEYGAMSAIGYTKKDNIIEIGILHALFGKMDKDFFGSGLLMIPRKDLSSKKTIRVWGPKGVVTVGEVIVEDDSLLFVPSHN